MAPTARSRGGTAAGGLRRCLLRRRVGGRLLCRRVLCRRVLRRRVLGGGRLLFVRFCRLGRLGLLSQRRSELRRGAGSPVVLLRIDQLLLQLVVDRRRVHYYPRSPGRVARLPVVRGAQGGPADDHSNVAHIAVGTQNSAPQPRNPPCPGLSAFRGGGCAGVLRGRVDFQSVSAERTGSSRAGC